MFFEPRGKHSGSFSRRINVCDADSCQRNLGPMGIDLCQDLFHDLHHLQTPLPQHVQTVLQPNNQEDHHGQQVYG